MSPRALRQALETAAEISHSFSSAANVQIEDRNIGDLPCTGGGQAKVCGVFIVSPTYFGTASPIRELAEICHEHAVPLIVDEAHGGHFGLHRPSPPPPLPPPPSPTSLNGIIPRLNPLSSVPSLSPPTPPSLLADLPHSGSLSSVLPLPLPTSEQPPLEQDSDRPPSRQMRLPPSALSEGADCVIHSTHKSLSAMTQAAMLHLGFNSKLNPDQISKSLQLLQSSSPSYILMASLDAARAMVEQPGFLDEPMAAAQVERTEHLGGLRRVTM